MKLWYLSFVGDKGFLGGCVVKATTIEEAIRRSWRLKINPGGEVMCIPVPAGREDMLPLNRLMTRQELEEYGPVARKRDMENPPQEIGLN